MIKSFKDIIAWQKAHKLTLEIYRITENYPVNENYGLTSQMRRSSVSVASNIVEGFKRKSRKDKSNFITISISSLEELKYQIVLSRDLKYINSATFNILSKKAIEVSKLLHSWKKSHQ